MIKNYQKKFNKKIASLFIIVTLFSSFSPVFTKKADAWFFVDWVNLVVNTTSAVGTHAGWIKEYGLDAVAGQVMNMVMQRIVASTVTWINSGFQGKPAFVTNPEAFFGDIGDKVAGNYIFNNTNLDFLCGPLRNKIKLALTQSYGGDRKRWQCTLTQIGQNMDNFMADFDNGGWNNFFELTQRPQNNPIGAYLQAEGELLQRIAQKQDIQKTDLLQGKGFLSYKKCKRYATKKTQAPQGADDNGNTDPANSAKELEDNFFRNSPGSTDAVITDDNGNPLTPQETQKLNCLEEETLTPGDVISNQINQKLGFAGNKLVTADEINEIVSALLNQVVTKIVGTIGSGLGSLSRPSVGPGGGQSFTSQLNPTKEQEDQVNRYFVTSAQQTNEVLDPNNTPNFNACRDNPTLPECLPPPGAPCNPLDTSCTQQTNTTCDPSIQECPAP